MKKRFFVKKENVFDTHILLDGNECLHLTKILRMRQGDEVECFFDNSKVFLCKIESIKKQSANLLIVSCYECVANPQNQVTLFQALPKLDKLEFVSQKACELGVDTIAPFLSKFCIAKPNENKIERLKSIVVSSCKQCGRTKLLNVLPTKRFDEMLNMLSSFDFVVFANETEQSVAIQDVLKKSHKNVAIVVGSEGGFSAEEVQQIISAGGTSVSLGKRILRAETAAICTCAIVCNFLGG